jgi:hypothetical protein
LPFPVDIEHGEIAVAEHRALDREETVLPMREPAAADRRASLILSVGAVALGEGVEDPPVGPR